MTIYTAAIPELKLPTIRKGYKDIRTWAQREQIEVANEYQQDLWTAVDLVPVVERVSASYVSAWMGVNFVVMERNQLQVLEVYNPMSYAAW